LRPEEEGFAVQAIVVDTGAPHGLSLGEVPDPVPQPDEVLLGVEHVTMVARNVAHAATLPVGTVPGFDAVGTVLRAADDGSGPPVGARVVSLRTLGAWAQLRAVSAVDLAVVPAGVEAAVAGTLATPGVSALRALRASGTILGRRILVTGAAGAVGLFAVQLACMGGATVIASVRNPCAADRLRELGAHEVAVGLDGVSAPVDVVLDTVGGPQLAEAFALLRDGGLVQAIGASSDQPTTFAPYALIGPQHRRVEGFWAGDRCGADLAELLALAAEGVLALLEGERRDWHDIDAIVGRLHGPDAPARLIVATAV
jgi:NADPH:quinone reductase